MSISDRQILEAIRQGRATLKTGPTQSQMAQGLGVTRQAIQQRLQRLEACGAVQPLGNGYGLTKAGKKMLQ